MAMPVRQQQQQQRLSVFNPWLILAFCALAQYLTISFVLILPVFLEPIREEFGISYQEVSWTFSISATLLFGGGPIGTMMLNRFGYKKTVFFGGLLASIAQCAASFAPNYVSLVILLGVINGIALSIVTVGINVVPSFLVSAEKRHIAIALVFAGSGVGFCTLPLLFQELINVYNWRWALFILSAISLHNCATAAILPEPRRSLPDAASSDSQKLEWSLLKRPLFLLVLFLCVAVELTVVGLNTFLFSLLVTYGFDPATTVPVLMSIYGLSTFVGRLSVSLLRENRIVPRWWIWMMLNLLNGVVTCMYGLKMSLAETVVLQIAYGLLIGAIFPLHVVILTELFPPAQLASTFGFSYFAFGIGSLIGAPLAGALRDTTKSYFVPCMVIGAASIATFLLPTLWLIRYHLKKPPPARRQSLITEQLQPLTTHHKAQKSANA